jgi:ABC-type transport system involved in multi-copper enzyme maturation permease subunit
MMTALLKKDWRLNRVVVVAGLIISVMPYVLALANQRFFPEKYRPVGLREYLDTTQFAAMACLALVVVLAAAFGGLTFAAERRERNAEFLGMLPVSRGRIILSKLLVALACVTVLIAFHVLVLVVCDAWRVHAGFLLRRNGEGVFYAGGMAVAYAVTLFGIAWALSILLRSPAIAATIAIGIGAGLLFGGMAWAERAFDAWDQLHGYRTSEEKLLTIVCSASAAIGLLAILLSSAHYIRRVEP